MKRKCYIQNCNNIAEWWYVPCDNPPRLEASRYFCDEHISRGCSCTVSYETDEPELDDQGRLLPCVEYDYCKDGWEIS